MLANITINPKIIRKLLRKTENKFLSMSIVSRELMLDSREATEILNYMDEQGFIEPAGITGAWRRSIRGELLAIKSFDKEFKAETAKKHVKLLVERARIINSSKDFPDHITVMKITSECPINQCVAGGVHVAYSLSRKNITSAEYKARSSRLRSKSNRVFDNMVEEIFYPEEAVRIFLKSRSHVIKLKKYSEEEIQQIKGYKIFNADNKL